MRVQLFKMIRMIIKIRLYVKWPNKVHWFTLQVKVKYFLSKFWLFSFCFGYGFDEDWNENWELLWKGDFLFSLSLTQLLCEKNACTSIKRKEKDITPSTIPSPFFFHFKKKNKLYWWWYTTSEKIKWKPPPPYHQPYEHHRYNSRQASLTQKLWREWERKEKLFSVGLFSSSHGPM